MYSRLVRGSWLWLWTTLFYLLAPLVSWGGPLDCPAAVRLLDRDTARGLRVALTQLEATWGSVEWIGLGGESLVFRSKASPSRVLKVPRERRAEEQERFLRSARRQKKACQAAQAFLSTGVGLGFACPVSFGLLEPGIAYAVYPDAGDLSLGAWLNQKGSLSVGELRELLAQVLGSLSSLHSAGYVHRDLKPLNVAMVRGPRGLEPALLDLGLVTRIGARAKGRMQGVGSTPYTTRSQFQGRAATVQDDLHALGWLLNDFRPYLAESDWFLFEPLHKKLIQGVFPSAESLGPYVEMALGD